MEYYSAPRRILRGMRQLVYPRRCPFCNRVLGSMPECPDCAEELDSLRRKPSMRLDPEIYCMENLDGGAAPFWYSGCVRNGILRAKYNAAPWAAVEMGIWLARLPFGSEIRMKGAEPLPQHVEGISMGYDCIVPVPPSSKRRGYNVPYLMSLPLAEALGLPVCPEALRRVRLAKHQAGLSFKERFANVAGAFEAENPELVEGKRVLLVDDVITTGLTASACTQALMDAGAYSVFAVAMATAKFDKRSSNEIREEENGQDF